MKIPTRDENRNAIMLLNQFTMSSIQVNFFPFSKFDYCAPNANKDTKEPTLLWFRYFFFFAFFF